MINVKEIVQQLGMSEETLQNLMGIDKMQWNISNYKENTEEVSHKLDMMLLNTTGFVDRFMQKKAELDSLATLVKQQLGKNAEDNVWIDLYKKSDDAYLMLTNVVNELCIMILAQDTAMRNQKALLQSASEAGWMHKELEMKIKEIKDMRELDQKGQEAMRTQFFEFMTKNTEKFAKLIELAEKPVIDYSVVDSKVADVRMENTALRERLNQLETQMQNLVMKVASAPKGGGKDESEDEYIPNFLNEMEKAVRDEGITDLMTMQKHMSKVMGGNVSLQKIRTNGFKEIVTKYTSPKKKAKKETDNEDDDEESEEGGEAE